MADDFTFTDADNQKRTARATDVGAGALASHLFIEGLPLPPGAATEATLATVAKQGAAITGETLGAGGSGVLGWLSQISSWLRLRLPAALGSNGGLKIELASGATLVLPAGAATETTIAAILAAVDKPSQNIFGLADISVTATPAALTTRACRWVALFADPANTQDILLGNSTVQTFPLKKGDDFEVSVTNVNLLWAKSVSGTQILHAIAGD